VAWVSNIFITADTFMKLKSTYSSIALKFSFFNNGISFPPENIEEEIQEKCIDMMYEVYNIKRNCFSNNFEKILNGTNHLLEKRRSIFNLNFDLFKFCQLYDELISNDKSSILRPEFPIGYVNENDTIKYLR
jgi:hypothetical protein